MNVTTTAPVRLTRAGALLGESPRWDDRGERLLWVDLWGGVLHTTDPSTGESASREVAPPLSSVVLTTRGTTVVTQGLCVLELDDDGLRHLVDLPEDDCLRANDAAADAAGRLWVGTMHLPGRAGQALGSLWRWEPGERTPVRVRDGYRLANGLGWSPAGDLMYVVDSRRQKVAVHEYDVGTGALGPAEPFVDVPGSSGLPDGLAVAADGTVWVALAGGSAVQRYGVDGSLLDRVELPVTHPTSCVFGGPGLSDLYVTTGSRQVPPEHRAAAVAAGAGAVFRAGFAGTGLPPHRVDLS